MPRSKVDPPRTEGLNDRAVVRIRYDQFGVQSPVSKLYHCMEGWID